MKKGTVKLKIFTFFLLVFTFPFLTFNSAAAQLLPPPLSLTSLPSSPSPGQQFTVTAGTPTFDKDTAFFEWTVDGKAQPELSGFGSNVITLTAGKAGDTARISARASRSEGETAQASLAATASDLALVWRAESFTPRWYKGKTLAAPNSTVAVTAIPQIILGRTTLRPADLIYRWSIDNERNALTGVGKQTFRFRASHFVRTTHQVDVVIEDVDRKILKHGRVLITTASPRLGLYPATPLGGIEFRAANFFATAKRGLFDFIAEPFFLPVSDRGALNWNWNIDGVSALGRDGSPHLITIDTSRRQAGRVQISATADDTNILTPSVSKSLTIFLQ